MLAINPGASSEIRHYCHPYEGKAWLTIYINSKNHYCVTREPNNVQFFYKLNLVQYPKIDLSMTPELYRTPL